jgi:pimeloyl-ACP methyl ester carboxylesterase
VNACAFINTKGLLYARRRPAWADVFPNHLLAKRITTPLLVLHGTADEVRNLQGVYDPFLQALDVRQQLLATAAIALPQCCCCRLLPLLRFSS